VSHYGLAIYIKKYLKAKEEELCKTQIFHHAKINLQKSSKRNQNPSRYYKNPHIKIDLILLPRGAKIP
jgi:hypothetical protein